MPRRWPTARRAAGRADCARVHAHALAHILTRATAPHTILPQDNAPIMFKVKRTIKFEKIFAAFAAKRGTTADAYKFMCVRARRAQPVHTLATRACPHATRAPARSRRRKDGEQVKKDDTPDGINMEEGDQLDALVQQTGGA